MLKVTRVELEKISDVDIYLFIEKGLKGETSYSKANSKYIKNYDPTKPS